MDRQSATEMRIRVLRRRLEVEKDLNAMEAYNIVRAIVHYEQELVRMD